MPSILFFKYGFSDLKINVRLLMVERESKIMHSRFIKAKDLEEYNVIKKVTLTQQLLL